MELFDIIRQKLSGDSMKKKVPVFLIFIFFVYIIYKGFTFNGIDSFQTMFTNEKALQNVNNFIQIIVGVSVVLGAVIAIWQYVLTARCERAKIKNDRIQKAIDLAEYYKDNILPELVALRFVFDTTGISKILLNIKSSQMNEFDNIELQKCLSQSSIDKIKELMQSKKMAETILVSEQIYGLNLNLENYVRSTKGEKGELQIEINKDGIYRRFMSQIINKMLNNMEYFSMNFSHGIADESVVYQSLHQTYIEAVQLLYYNIAINNKPDGMQFYTNVVKLYKKWYKRNVQKKREVAHSGREIVTGENADDLS